MSRDWESVFTNWAQAPSPTEQQKIDNAESQIRAAIASSEKLKNRNIRVFTQGSYRNRVNVELNRCAGPFLSFSDSLRARRCTGVANKR